MKIAVVGPSAVPFTIGGAEYLLNGLYDAINKYTPHQADLIKLPSREHSFWDLIHSYYDFYMLDLKHFDMVISTKYPSWMVRHPKSVCYMIHCLRGLYDTYPENERGKMIHSGCFAVDEILLYMDNYPHPADLDEFFELLFRLEKEAEGLSPDLFRFPGPFIQKLIQYLDLWGLSQCQADAFFTMSETVKKRTSYFPPYANVKIINPPTHSDDTSVGNYEYLFMISRLDSPKRIDMLIRAMQHVPENVELRIAGTGPQEKELRELAKDDKRIRFLGFVSDAEVIDLYKNALAVPYFPYDEDYGYITIEAMLHQKPVITTYDSGGPTEFVQDGKTGLLTDFNEKAIAEKISSLCRTPEKAREMGKNAYSRVKDISWKNAVSTIFEHLNEYEEQERSAGRRRKITIVSTYPIYPPLGGGQSRCYHLYKELAKVCDVEIVSFAAVGESNFSGRIASGMYETRIAKSAEHQQIETENEMQLGIPITDIGMTLWAQKTPEYMDALKKSMADSDMVLLAHPYLLPAVEKYRKKQILIYDAHNVESRMKEAILPEDIPLTKQMLKTTFDVEKRCCEICEIVTACSQEDAEIMKELYNLDIHKCVVIPNGVETKQTTFVSLAQRLAAKKDKGLENEAIGLFMGSWHLPNIEAAKKIIELARKCPDVKFMLMGSQCMYFENQELPANVGLLGLVSDLQKLQIFSCIDFALNPMESGSGTNLKMFDYMSAGIPVISTPFGARGIESNMPLFIPAEIREMAHVISDFDLEDHEDMILAARKYMVDYFDWNVVALPLLDKIRPYISEANEDK